MYVYPSAITLVKKQGENYMAARKFLILGFLLMTQSAWAIREGTYRTQQSNLVLEAAVWTEGEYPETVQFIKVHQVAPVVKEIPQVYMLVQTGTKLGTFESGDLVLTSLQNRSAQGRNDFVTYSEPVSMKVILNLTKPSGKQFEFHFVDGLIQN
jgi:hypothetical protein